MAFGLIVIIASAFAWAFAAEVAKNNELRGEISRMKGQQSVGVPVYFGDRTGRI